MSAKRKRSDVNPFCGYLNDGESILWLGQPDPHWLLSPDDMMLIPFSLLWGGFAIFWELSALGGGAPFSFALWGIPFVVVGQYLIWGRFLHKYLRYQRTYYAVTEQRALVLNTLIGSNLKTYFLHRLPTLQLRGRALLFADEDTSNSRKRRNWQTWAGETQPGFYALADADEVYQLIQELTWERKPKEDWN
ncbi:MAG: PH domain-containing protein [Anaerolineae bacterium]|nr:PH domain-containing protein [Anaerolineae bacterium]